MFINGNAPRVRAYHALPDAIPETKWLVVAVDADGTPIRDPFKPSEWIEIDGEQFELTPWLVAAEHETLDAAERDAEARTRALDYVTF